MERQVPGHHARLLAQPRRAARGLRLSLYGLIGPLRQSGQAADSIGQPAHAHDGFTLADLVSYGSKHNEANGEGNRDGTDDNRSWNCGAEGGTTNPDILALRARQWRAMLTTLLLSFGVPLLLGGDEMGRTQKGNNNAYCQDNSISWFDWGNVDADLQAFTRRVVSLRRGHPVFRRRRFLGGVEASELRWYTPSGVPMAPADWNDPNARSLSLYLDGDDDPDPLPTAPHLRTTTFCSLSMDGGSLSISSSPPRARARDGTWRSKPSGAWARAWTARWQYIDSWPAVGRRTSRPYPEQELGPNGARDIVKVRRARNARRFLLLRVCSGRRYAAPIVNRDIDSRALDPSAMRPGKVDK